MLTIAAAFTALLQIDLDPRSLLGHQQHPPAVSCEINIVGYRFIGRPGQVLVYADETFEIPAEGWIELIADRKRITYACEGVSISFETSSSLDPFGFLTVALPTPTGASEP